MAETGVERDPARMSAHQTRVQEFMLKGEQHVPLEATMPDEATRLLRARLLMEETLETIRALGVWVNHEGCLQDGETTDIEITDLSFGISPYFEPDFEGIIDGCADLSVVTIGTLIACGVDDVPVLREVDRSNMTKFREGWYRRDDGKIVKSPLYEPAKYAVVEAFKARQAACEAAIDRGDI